MGNQYVTADVSKCLASAQVCWTLTEYNVAGAFTWTHEQEEYLHCANNDNSFAAGPVDILVETEIPSFCLN